MHIVFLFGASDAKDYQYQLQTLQQAGLVQEAAIQETGPSKPLLSLIRGASSSSCCDSRQEKFD